MQDARGREAGLGNLVTQGFRHSKNQGAGTAGRVAPADRVRTTTARRGRVMPVNACFACASSKTHQMNYRPSGTVTSETIEDPGMAVKQKTYRGREIPDWYQREGLDELYEVETQEGEVQLVEDDEEAVKLVVDLVYEDEKT